MSAGKNLYMQDEPDMRCSLMYLPQHMKERQGTRAFTEYILHGWTSEVFQLLFLDKVNNETLSVS